MLPHTEVFEFVEDMLRTSHMIRIKKHLVWLSLFFMGTMPHIWGGDRPLDIFLCIGQSNMAGRAPIPEENMQPLANVYLWTNHDEWEIALGGFNRYSTIKHPERLQGVSPAYGFALYLSEQQPERKFGFVVNARGGTKIERWAKGTEYFEEAVKRTQAALAGGGKLAGILWHQGESNRTDSDYEAKLVALIDDLRSAFDSPDLPFIVGQVNGRNPVNTTLANLPEIVPMTACASSAGLTRMDRFHFDAPSTLELGKRMAIQWLKLLQPEYQSSSDG